MFLVKDGQEIIERKLRDYLRKEPSVGVILAAVFFEWTIGRALICLSLKPNHELRSKLQKCHGLDAYKKIWKIEVNGPGLPEIVEDWRIFKKAFNKRHILVHGRGRVTYNMASPHFESILSGVNDIWKFCSEREHNLAERLPIRRK